MSSRGGRDPRFSPDGHRIYYRSPTGRLVVVAVDLSGHRVDAGVPEIQFDLNTPEELGYMRNTFDLKPDGKGLVVLRTSSGDRSIRVRTGWRMSGR